MTPVPPTLEIRLQLVNGQCYRFAQHEPEPINAILESVAQPAKFFQQPSLVIGGDRSTSVFRPDHILRLDLIMDQPPRWENPHGALLVQEVTPEVFARAFDAEQYAALRTEAWRQPGRKQVGFTEMEMMDQSRFLFAVAMQSVEMVPADITTFALGLLNTGGCPALRIDRGVLLVNTAHVARMTFYPGPPVLPPRAWNAYRYKDEG